MSEWYKSLPIYKNQPQRSLENFDENNKFEDEAFKAAQESFITTEKLKTLKDEDDLKLAKLNITWKRISDFPDFNEYDIFPPELNCDNFEQGFFGDCYFLSMVALISNYGELLKRLFPIKKNPYGYYEVILFINGWKRIIIDDRIPGIINKDNQFIPITARSKKYENCFYHILLEKAWAKVNGMYFNINGVHSNNSLTILTGFKSEFIKLNTLNNDDKKQLFYSIKKGINKEGFLFGVNTLNHAYSLLDIEETKLDNVYILKVRNPHGIIGNNLTKNLKANNCLGLLNKFFNEGKNGYIPKNRYFVEPELESRFENFKFPEDTGIFYISSTYFFDFFDSYNVCYNMFGAFIIEYSFTFIYEDKDFRKKFFNFKVKAKKNSVVQFNITNYSINKFGKYKFNSKFYTVYIDGKRDTYNSNKLKANTEYFICWTYKNDLPSDDILFWIPYKGNIEVEFLGISKDKKSKDDGIYEKKGFIVNTNKYKITEKLGEYYRRRAEMINLVENGFGKRLISDVEEKGYSFEYLEDYDDTVAITYITNTEDPNDRDILSQNLINRDIIFKGKDAFRRRIIGKSEILIKKENKYTKQYSGWCYYNLFNQYPHEDNKGNILIKNLLMKRLNLAQGRKKEEFLNIITLKGPFIGQEKFTCHINNHYLSNLLTDRKNIDCNCCGRRLESDSYSYFCSECNFSHCNITCGKKPIKNSKDPYANYLISTKQHNHRLIKCKIKEPNNIHKCFNCLRILDNYEKIYYCTICDFRLCQKCEINEKCGQSWQFHTCWHEHPLTLCNTEGRKNISETSNKQLHDEEDEEDEEDTIKESYTKPYEKRATQTQVITITENVEDDNEPRKKKDKTYLVFEEKIEPYIDPPDDDFYFRCNHCGTQYLRTNEVLYCTACDFYICIKCQIKYSLYLGRDEENVVPNQWKNGEFLPTKCRCFIGLEKMTHINCSCGIKLKLEEWNYYCSFCNSLFCDKCYGEHKVIFENNILVFDGNFSENCRFGSVYKKNNELSYSGTWINGINNLIEKIPHLERHSRSYKKINFNEETFCDICARKCDLYDEGYNCSECKLNICINCVIEINERKVKIEKHEHNLNIIKYSEGKKCSVCEKSKNGIMFFCSVCNTEEGLLKVISFIWDFFCCLDCFRLQRHNKYL